MASTDAAPPQTIIRDLQTADGTSQATVTLQGNKDATKPPVLVDISKQALQAPNPDTSSQRETHVVISIGSGGRQAESFFENVVKPVLVALDGEARTSTLKIHTTTSATSIADYTSTIFFPAANSGTPLRIILLSGDGGIVDLVNGLLSHTQSDTYIAPPSRLAATRNRKCSVPLHQRWQATNLGRRRPRIHNIQASSRLHSHLFAWRAPARRRSPR